MTDDQFRVIGKRLAHNQYWPKFNDVDQLVLELKRQHEPKPYQGNVVKLASDKVIDKELSKLTIQDRAKLAAKRLWPDADPEFLEGIVVNCTLELVNKDEFDLDCARCEDGSQCRRQGHRAVLRIEEDAKVPLVCLESAVEECCKYTSWQPQE